MNTRINPDERGDEKMSVVLEIPDQVAHAIRLPASEQ